MTFDSWILELVYEHNGYGIIFYVLITSFFAVLLSFLVAIERQLRGKSISIKTHVLLAVGCSLMMTISIWAIRIADGSIDIIDGVGEGTKLSYDTSRIAAAVITGMGFLGAGSIIRDKFSVKGITTASTLWICSAIGLACGSGFVLESIVFTLFVLTVLFLLTCLGKIIKKKVPSILIETNNEYPLIKTIDNIGLENDIQIRGIDIIEVNEKTTTARIRFPLNYNKAKIEYFKNQIRSQKDIKVL